MNDFVAPPLAGKLNQVGAEHGKGDKGQEGNGRTQRERNGGEARKYELDGKYKDPERCLPVRIGGEKHIP